MAGETQAVTSATPEQSGLVPGPRGGMLNRGPGLGKPKGALNKFTKLMREEGALMIREMEARGVPANPIRAMLHVLETAFNKGDLELMLRASIAVADRYLPAKTAIEIDVADAGESEQKVLEIQARLAKWTPRRPDAIAPTL
jgi:hypothetical protein